MNNCDLNFFKEKTNKLKRFLCRFSPRFFCNAIPEANKRSASITSGQLREMGSINFMNLSLKTIVETIGKVEKSLQINFLHTKIVSGAER